jgi:hypothetical protein
MTYFASTNHFAVAALPIVFASGFSIYDWPRSSYGSSQTLDFVFLFWSNLTLSTPLHQDAFILLSSCFIKGPLNLLEVLSCCNCCYNLCHIHYYNLTFICSVLLLSLLILLTV